MSEALARNDAAPLDAAPLDYEALARDYGALDGLALLTALLAPGGPLVGRTALVSSFGAESAAMLDMVALVDRNLPVIMLDTGKLFEETHDHRDRLIDRLGLTNVRVIGPDAKQLSRHDPDGMLWSRDPDFCCHLRKTEPLGEALREFDAWITGRKRYQGGLRTSLPTVEEDRTSGRIKINPFANWPSEAVEQYSKARGLPAHPLVDQGYLSIGCVPCTDRVKPGESPRSGRWRGLDKSECGIHAPGQ